MFVCMELVGTEEMTQSSLLYFSSVLSTVSFCRSFSSFLSLSVLLSFSFSFLSVAVYFPLKAGVLSARKHCTETKCHGSRSEKERESEGGESEREKLFTLLSW